MKECPICQASCFDDMDVCFGCLHCFEAGHTQTIDSLPLAQEADSNRGAHRRHTALPAQSSPRDSRPLVVIPLGPQGLSDVGAGSLSAKGSPGDSVNQEYHLEISLVPTVRDQSSREEAPLHHLAITEVASRATPETKEHGMPCGVNHSDFSIG